MTTQQTAAICNRHIARLMTDLETLGCSAEVKNTVRTEMRWLRNDLTKDGPTDCAEAFRFYHENACHLPGVYPFEDKHEYKNEPRPIARAFNSMFGCLENEFQIEEQWAEDIDTALKVCESDIDAASLIMQWLCDHHRVKFGTDCHSWITALVGKWRGKTPDRKQQAESISRAIYRQLTPNKPSSKINARTAENALDMCDER